MTAEYAALSLSLQVLNVAQAAAAAAGDQAVDVLLFVCAVSFEFIESIYWLLLNINLREGWQLHGSIVVLM